MAVAQTWRAHTEEALREAGFRAGGARSAVIDLLAGQAEKAKAILDNSPPSMSKRQYLDLQDTRLTDELYEGR